MLRSAFDDIEVERSELFGLRHLLVMDELPGPLSRILRSLLYGLDNNVGGSSWIPGTAIYAVGTKRRP